jgi:DNA-binding beta-propeller fold protein YncE
MNTEISRRRLLQGAIAGAPMILGATDKAGNKRPILGEGEYKYEAIHDWGELPSTIKYGNTHGVARDSQGHIYVHHTVYPTSESSDTVVVFDEKGKFVRSWGKQYKSGAHGLHIQKEGNTEYIFLCDMLHSIVTKRTLAGEEVFSLGYPAESKAYKLGPDKKRPVYRPTNLAIAPTGDIYVADGYGSSYVNRYNSQGEYLQTFGGLGEERGRFSTPHGIWVDTRGSDPIVTVADRSNHRIQTFTLGGKPIGIIEGVKKPCHFHHLGEIVVVPDLTARVTLLDRENKVILHLGDGGDDAPKLRTKERSAFIPGKFICPHSACFDPDGNILVVEYVEVGRVTKLRKIA